MQKLLVAAFLVFCAVPAIAQVPSGQFTYAFTNPPLWDTSGIYTNSVSGDTVIATLQHQANGQLIGTRSETYVSGADHATGSGSFAGRVSVRAGVVTARDTSEGSLAGVSGGVSYVANFKAKGVETLNPSTLSIFTSGTIKVCVVGGKCVTSTQGYSIPLPDGMDGTWTLDINIAADGNKLAGTGAITLSNGRVLSYQIKGSYNTKSQVAKLKLVGQGDATGTSLSLTTQGTGMDLTSLKGKVLGQKPTFP